MRYYLILFDINYVKKLYERVDIQNWFVVKRKVLFAIKSHEIPKSRYYMFVERCLSINKSRMENPSYIIWAWRYIIVASGVMSKILGMGRNQMLRIQVGIWAWRCIIISFGVPKKIHCVRSNVGYWESKSKEIGVTSSELGVTSQLPLM